MVKLYPNRMVERGTRNYFCEDVISAGTPLFISYEKIMSTIPQDKVVTPKPIGVFVGISLCDVVKIDYLKCLTVNILEISTGSKIDILTRGTITVDLPSRYGKIPHGQPIYWNGRSFTLKVVSPQIGYVVSKDNGKAYDIYIKGLM